MISGFLSGQVGRYCAVSRSEEPEADEKVFIGFGHAILLVVDNSFTGAKSARRSSETMQGECQEIKP